MVKTDGSGDFSDGIMPIRTEKEACTRETPRLFDRSMRNLKLNVKQDYSIPKCLFESLGQEKTRQLWLGSLAQLISQCVTDWSLQLGRPIEDDLSCA